MKTIQIMLLAVTFTFSSMLSASTEPSKSEPSTAVSSEIQKLLKNPDFTFKYDMTAQVKVVVNENNELVVLSIETENQELESFIKGRLNYKTLKVKLETGQKSYIVPVRITQED